MIDVAEEEATREIQRFGGQEALDEPYLSTSLPAMVRKRASWLVILFVGEMFTATAMGYFEDEIARTVVLALFVPLIISSGGNSGSQAATLIIRALALGEVGLRDWWRVLRRELLAGLMLGVILGSIGFLRIAAWSAVSRIYGETLVPRRPHRRRLAGRRRDLGHPHRLHAPIHPQAARLRPRHLLRPVRRDPRQRHRPRHLLHHRDRHPPRYGLLSLSPAPTE